MKLLEKEYEDDARPGLIVALPVGIAIWLIAVAVILHLIGVV